VLEFSHIQREHVLGDKIKDSKMKAEPVKVILYKILGLGCVSVLEKCVV
jgi:hypothetical protein